MNQTNPLVSISQTLEKRSHVVFIVCTLKLGKPHLFQRLIFNKLLMFLFEITYCHENIMQMQVVIFNLSEGELRSYLNGE